MKLDTLKRKLVPPEEVAGLEIGDAFARLVLLSPETSNVITAAETAIPAGTIELGKVKSIANLASSLEALKQKAGSDFKAQPLAILSLPSGLFFTHILELPEMSEKEYEESARLNATQLSPIHMQEAYFDWQNLGVDLQTLARQIYIALAAKSDIDEYLEAASRAGIDIVAVEPGSLGFIRLLTHYVLTAEKQAAHLIVAITQDGMNFVITKDAKPLFDYYFYWKNTPEAKDGKITVQDFENIFRRELSRILSFYATRYRDSITNGVLFTPIFPQELADMLRNDFKIKVVGHRLPSYAGNMMSAVWAGALGAALRGVIKRSEDTIVSLMPVGTEELFRRKQFQNFVSVWGGIVAGVFAGLSLLFGIVFAIGWRLRLNEANVLQVLRRSENFTELQRLSEKAKTFNSLVEKAREARSMAKDSSAIFDFMALEAANNIKYQRISFDTRTLLMSVNAFAPNRNEALAFRKRMEDSGRFSKIDMPLVQIIDVPGGVNFTISAQVKSL